MIRSRMERGKYFPIFRDIDFFKLYIYIGLISDWIMLMGMEFYLLVDCNGVWLKIGAGWVRFESSANGN